MKRIQKMLFIGLIALAAEGMVFAGGGKQSGQQGGGGSSSAPITIMLPLYYQEAPSSGSPLEKAMEEFTGLDIEFQFVPIDSYNERLNLAITSNNMPSVVAVLDPKLPVWINAVRSGMFWDITDRFGSLPTLKANYDAQALINAQIDGKLYGLPRGRALTRDGMVIRKDWLKNVGITRDLTQPATLDDIYTIAKAFAQGDPDKNGRNDTTGLLVCMGQDGNLSGYILEMLDVANGGGNKWQEDGAGGLVYTYTTPNHFASLNWLRRMYNEGIINRDFASMRASQFYEAIDKEQAGFYFQTVTDAHERWDNVTKIVQARDPVLAKLPPTEAKAEFLDIITKIRDVNGNIRASTEPGFNGVLAFPKSSSKNDADLLKVLQLFDKLDTPEGQSVIEWGVQGRHYTLNASGQAVMTDNSLLFAAEVQPFWQMFCTNRVVDRASLKGYVAPMYTKVYSQMAALMPYAVYNPIIPLISDTYSTIGATVDKIIYDAQAQYIMGVIDEAGWWAAVNRWKREGGDKITTEYSEQYKKFKK
jgi:putative aldouronate transport system substrate-binding protein